MEREDGMPREEQKGDAKKQDVEGQKGKKGQIDVNECKGKMKTWMQGSEGKEGREYYYKYGIHRTLMLDITVARLPRMARSSLSPSFSLLGNL